MTTRARIDETGQWVRCGKCGHKLFKMITENPIRIEIKCSSCREINMFEFKNTVVRICPRCGHEYCDFPSISRRDNKTEICPDCGVEEALEDYRGYIDEIRFR